MDAQQCVKLNLTNRSTELVTSAANGAIRPQGPSGPKSGPVAHSDKIQKTDVRKQTTDDGQSKRLDETSATTICPPTSVLRPLSLDGLVAMARGSTPDPIPNSAVKTLSADGTAS